MQTNIYAYTLEGQNKSTFAQSKAQGKGEACRTKTEKVNVKNQDMNRNKQVKAGIMSVVVVTGGKITCVFVGPEIIPGCYWSL